MNPDHLVACVDSARSCNGAVDPATHRCHNTHVFQCKQPQGDKSESALLRISHTRLPGGRHDFGKNVNDRVDVGVGRVPAQAQP